MVEIKLGNSSKIEREKVTRIQKTLKSGQKKQLNQKVNFLAFKFVLIPFMRLIKLIGHNFVFNSLESLNLIFNRYQSF